MSWRATVRHGACEAPAGLALLQDLLNTRGITVQAQDLLARPEEAQRWVTEALTTWSRVSRLPSPVLLLSSTDVGALRRLRATFENVVLARGRQEEPEGTLLPANIPVSLVPDADGWVRMIPTGRGTRWLASALWTEALLAQQTGLWPRLKLCRNRHCRAAYFDTSYRNSVPWHEAVTCADTAIVRRLAQHR
jgi:hypothetical protein